MITPIKKTAHRDLLDWEKEFNKQVNKIRYVIGQVMANVKTWRIMHTIYCRPIEKFTIITSTVIDAKSFKVGLRQRILLAFPVFRIFLP